MAFVGREAELEVLDAAIARTVRFSSPRTISVIGALGLGKTRLVDEWLNVQKNSGVRIVRAAAEEPPLGGSLIAALLRARFGLAGCTESEALVQFRAELQRVYGDRRVAEVAALLGRYVGFDLTDSPLSRALAGRPEQAADVARAVLGRFFEQDAAARPLIIVCGDLHNADDRSLGLLEGLMAELADAPIVMVLTARPELLIRRLGWGNGQGNHTQLVLPPLSRASWTR